MSGDCDAGAVASTGAARDEAACESINGSIVGAQSTPANGPEAETDESSLAANIGEFILAIADHKNMNAIQNPCNDFFCVELTKPTGDQCGDHISNT